MSAAVSVFVPQHPGQAPVPGGGLGQQGPQPGVHRVQGLVVNLVESINAYISLPLSAFLLKLETKIREIFTITEKAPARANPWPIV